MDTPKRDDFGIWPYLLCALGCLTFTYRGIIALAGGQERMLEGSVFLTIGLVASVFVANAIWNLTHGSKHSGEASQFDPAHSSHPFGTED